MKAAERIESRFGTNMLQSLGVRSKMEPAQNSTPKTIAAASPDDGRTRLREAALVDLDRIVPDANQVRKQFDEDAISEMAQSLKDHGQLTPIFLRWDKELGKWVIIAGERRYRGAVKAGLKSLKAICFEGEITESDIRVYQLTENLQREDLKPIELAKSFEELMKLNSWTMDQLAAHIKKSKATISRSLALLKLPADVQQRVEKGELPASAAYEIAKSAKTADEQRAQAEQYVSQGLTRDVLTGKKAKPAVAPAEGNEDAAPKAKPVAKSFEVGTAIVTIKWQKANVRKRDIIAALEGALAEVRGDDKDAAESSS